jgi:hypothetical protein
MANTELPSAANTRRALVAPPDRPRFLATELAGAFGDLGTSAPFIAAYLAVVKLDPAAVLIAFGAVYIAVGAVYRTPLAVQPMKAIDAVAVSHSVPAALITPGTIRSPSGASRSRAV